MENEKRKRLIEIFHKRKNNWKDYFGIHYRIYPFTNAFGDELELEGCSEEMVERIKEGLSMEEKGFGFCSIDYFSIFLFPPKEKDIAKSVYFIRTPNHIIFSSYELERLPKLKFGDQHSILLKKSRDYWDICKPMLDYIL